MEEYSPMKIVDRKVITLTEEDVLNLIAKEVGNEIGHDVDINDIVIRMNAEAGPYAVPKIELVTISCDMAVQEKCQTGERPIRTMDIMLGARS